MQSATVATRVTMQAIMNMAVEDEKRSNMHRRHSQRAEQIYAAALFRAGSAETEAASAYKKPARISSASLPFEYLPEQLIGALSALLTDGIDALVQYDVSVIDENHLVEHLLDIRDEVCRYDDRRLGVVVADDG